MRDEMIAVTLEDILFIVGLAAMAGFAAAGVYFASHRE